jgi:hypothetical protein
MFGRVKRIGLLSRGKRIKFARRAGETTTRTRIKVEKRQKHGGQVESRTPGFTCQLNRRRLQI